MTWLQDYLATGMRDGFRRDLDRILLRRKTTTRSTNIMVRSANTAVERLDLSGTAIFENENNLVNTTAFYEYQQELLELLNQKEEGIRFVTQSNLERETPSGGAGVLSTNEEKDDGVHVESGALWGGISAGLLVLVSGLFVFCRRHRNSMEEEDASDKLREIPIPVEIKHTSSQRAAAEPSSLSLAEIARLSSPILNLADQEETDSSVEQSPLQPIVPTTDIARPLPEDDQPARSTSHSSSPLKKKVSFATTPPRKPVFKPEEQGDKEGEDEESSQKCESLSSAAAVCPTKASSPPNKHPKGVLNNDKPNIPPVVRTKTGTRPHIKAVKLFSGDLTRLLENQEEESGDTKNQLSDKGSKNDGNSDGSSCESVQLVDNQEEESCDTEEQPSDRGSDSDEDSDESSRKSVQLLHDVPPGSSSSVPENPILTCGVRAAKLLSGTVHVVDKTPEHQDVQEVDSATTGQSSKGSTYDGVEIVSVCSRSVSTKHSLTSLSKGEDSDGDTGTEGSRADSNGVNEDRVYEKDTLANVSLPEKAEEEPARAVLGESGVRETPKKNDQDDCSSEEESYSGWETDDNDSMDSADLPAVREGPPYPVDGRTKTTVSSPGVKATELLSGTFLDRTPEKKIVDGDSSFSENGSESTDHPLDDQSAAGSTSGPDPVNIIRRETEPIPTDSSDRVHLTATELLYGNFEMKDTKNVETSSSASVEFSEQDDAASSYSTLSAYKDARQSSQNSVEQGSFHSGNSVTAGSVYSDARQSIRSISENSSSFASAASSLASLHVRAQGLLFGSFQFGRSYNASSTTSSSRGDNDDDSNVYLYSSDDSSSGSSSREEQPEEVNQATTDSLGIEPCSSLDWKFSR